jgi:hypothetical protein
MLDYSMSETGNRNAGLQYRPDIDGLRAVAILSVLAFHLRPWRVPGGFVGVDVFFVISGAANRWHVSCVSLYQAICESGRCLEYADEKDGNPLLNDGDHLSEGGSRLLVRRLAGLGELDFLQDKLPCN